MADRMVIEVEVDAKGVQKGVDEAKSRLGALNKMIVAGEQQRTTAIKALVDSSSAAQSRAHLQTITSLNRQIAATKTAYAQQVQIVQAAQAQMQRAQAQTAQQSGGGVDLSGVIGLGKAVIAALSAATTKAVKDQLDLASALRTVQRESGATRDEAAQLIGVLQVLGVEPEALSTAFRSLANDIQNTPERFKALGIALNDTSGKARSTYAVMMDLRRVIAESRQDSATMAVAQETLGRSYQDLLPWLLASESDLQALNRAAQASGLVMSGPATKGAEELANASVGLTVALRGIAQTIAENVIPMLAKMTEMAAVGIDTLSALVNTKNLGTGDYKNDFSDIPVLGGLQNLFNNVGDTISGTPSDALKKINAQVNAQEKARRDIADILNRQRAALGTAGAGPSLGGATNAGLAGARGGATDALKDEQKLLRDIAADRIDKMQVELKAYLAEKNAALMSLDTQKKASQELYERQTQLLQAGIASTQAAFDRREKMRQREVDGINDAQKADQRATDARIRAIQDEMDAADRAFKARSEARDAERDALNAELKALDEAKRQEERAKSVAEAKTEIEKIGAEDMTRVRSESLEDYAKRVADHDKRLEDARKALADIEKSIADDVARDAIQKKIEEVDAKEKQDRKETDSARQKVDDNITEIRREAEVRQQDRDDRIASIQAVAAADRESTDLLVAQAQERLDALRAAQEEEQKTFDTLQMSLHFLMSKEQERVADAIDGIQRELAARVDAIQREIDAYGRLASAATTAYRVIQQAAQAPTDTGGGGGTRRSAGGFHGMVTQPTTFTAGEAGAERVDISTRGEIGMGSPGGMGVPEIVIPVTLEVDGKVLARVLGRAQYDAYRMTGGKN